MLTVSSLKQLLLKMGFIFGILCKGVLQGLIPPPHTGLDTATKSVEVGNLSCESHLCQVVKIHFEGWVEKDVTISEAI